MLEYEIPKHDGDLGNPNLFVPPPAETCQRKVDPLLEQLPSQRDHRWSTADTFRAMLCLRGVESNSTSGFAEGFHCRKATLDLPAGLRLSRRPCAPSPSRWSSG